MRVTGALLLPRLKSLPCMFPIPSNLVLLNNRTFSSSLLSVCSCLFTFSILSSPRPLTLFAPGPATVRAFCVFLYRLLSGDHIVVIRKSFFSSINPFRIANKHNTMRSITAPAREQQTEKRTTRNSNEQQERTTKNEKVREIIS
jgi:hypothetical protein